jgi:hypothetical protein
MHSRFLLPFATVLALSLAGCTITFDPAPGLPIQAPIDLPYVNTELALRPYPNSTTVFHQESGRTSRTEFETSANLTTVFAHFHTRLRSDGWTRTRFDVDTDAGRALAGYERDGSTFAMTLARLGQSDRYRLEIR